MGGLPVNKNFFNAWNSKMSYVLGVITADGGINIKRMRKDGSKQYLLDITSKDISLLRKIRKAMQARQKIGVKYGGCNKKEKCFRIQIGHQEICKSLLNLGIQPKKTYNLDPIKVPEKYFPEFVRGFFDGDGTVYIYKVNGTPQIKAGFGNINFSFIKDFSQHLCHSLGIPLKTINQENSKKEIRYVIDFYIDDCEKLAEFMYRNNPSLYLPRKRRVFEKWKSIKRRHYVKQHYPSKVGWRLNQKLLV